MADGVADFLDGFGEGFIVLDADWRVLLINRAAESQEVASRGWLGHALWELAPERFDPRVERALRTAMADRLPAQFEGEWLARTKADFCIRLFPLGRGLGVSFRDVTAQNLLRAREREQARRLDFLLAANDIGVTHYDLATREVTLSSRAAEILGVAPALRLPRERIEENQPYGQRAEVDALVQNAVDTGEILEHAFRVRRPAAGDEAWVMVRTRAQYDDDGHAVGLLGVVVDISGLKAQEARLRESEARFRAFADCAPTPLWVTRADGGLEFANEAAVAFGMAGDLLGRHGALDAVHPDDRARVARLRADSWAKREPYEYVGRLRSAEGEWRWIRAIHHPRFDHEGAFLGYIGVFMDITDIRNAEARQRLLVNELNHRVKNTLATVQSVAQQTLRPGLDPQLARDKFIDRLLALSAAHNVLTREHWKGADVMEIAVAAVRPYGQADRIRLRGPPASVAPNIAVALSMVLHELAANAAGHGALAEAGGRVSLVWRLAPKQALLCFRWRERGGRRLAPPERSGFGTRLLTRGLTLEFGAPAKIKYLPDGLLCMISAPVLREAPDVVDLSEHVSPAAWTPFTAP